MHISKSIRSFMVGLSVLGAVALTPQRAQASLPFPEAIQEAADMPCVPSCTLCHGVDPGTAGTYMKKLLGRELFAFNGNFVKPGDSAALKANFAAYALVDANKANVALLREGKDPETGVDLCASGMRYGCGAHVASKAPPRDLSGVLWVAGAIVIGALVRRRSSHS